MARVEFKSFQEASAFAKNLAITTKSTSFVNKEGDIWWVGGVCGENDFDIKVSDRVCVSKNEFDADGYDKSGYNQLGFNKHSVHKVTKTFYAPDGYDHQGYDKQGYHKESGIHKLTQTICDPYGIDKDGNQRITKVHNATKIEYNLIVYSKTDGQD